MTCESASTTFHIFGSSTNEDKEEDEDEGGDDEILYPLLRTIGPYDFEVVTDQLRKMYPLGHQERTTTERGYKGQQLSQIRTRPLNSLCEKPNGAG